MGQAGPRPQCGCAHLPRLAANALWGEAGTESQAAGEWPGGCGWRGKVSSLHQRSTILGDQELIWFLQALRELGRPFRSLGCPVDSAGMLLANPPTCKSGFQVPRKIQASCQETRPALSPLAAGRGWLAVTHGRHRLTLTRPDSPLWSQWQRGQRPGRPGRCLAACPGQWGRPSDLTGRAGRMASKHTDLRAGSSRTFPCPTLSLLCLGATCPPQPCTPAS